ncbi:hypothetical protein BP5796_04626 [Coleophoma crateriformis]|uniref:WW domain-containing protein n=1 Tax=Coleophoma crateriformis TaxID=565419 RepID=A0A3D8S9W8_9HELO|nr:hypothetical protein BP5796_04626 [Coleophoma crateriformis]
MCSPGQEGPSFGPPQVPQGWIAQWDGVSRKYYFVQLATGESTWETPTQPAPAGPTPQATPQGVDHPHGLPEEGHEGGTLISNADGSQSIRYPDGRIEPYNGESDRSLGSFAMNQLLGGHKQSGQSSGVMGLASQFLGGKTNTHSGGSSSSSGAAGIVGALAGSLLGGKKQNNQQQQQTNYSGSQPHQGQSGGLMGSLGGMFGGNHGSSGGNNYGYSSGNSHQQGGYSGQAPPSSYQPAGGASSYSPAPQQHQQQQQHSSYPQQSYGAPPQGQQPQYGQGQEHQQAPYGGGMQHQNSYGPSGHQQPSPAQHQYPPPPNQQYPPPPSQHFPPPPSYGAPPQHSGNLEQPQHQHFQGLHNAEHSGGLYGNGGQHPPPPPMNSHPYGGQQGAQKW